NGHSLQWIEAEALISRRVDEQAGRGHEHRLVFLAHAPQEAHRAALPAQQAQAGRLTTHVREDAAQPWHVAAYSQRRLFLGAALVRQAVYRPAPGPQQEGHVLAPVETAQVE